jgi:hypothetical protein
MRREKFDTFFPSRSDFTVTKKKEGFQEKGKETTTG